MTNEEFKASQEAAFRRVVRATIRKAPFTKSERDVTLALVNHWFFHRNGKKGYIHPGREKLAKKANVSVKTASRCLGFLRSIGAITATAHLAGLHGDATEYTVNIVTLLHICELKSEVLRVNGGTNGPTRGRDKMSHRSCDVIAFPSQGIARS